MRSCSIGAAREKDGDYEAAVKAYETAADRYHNQPVIAADAMYRWAIAYQKQATKAEYDQGKAGQAIAAYTDFMTIFPTTSGWRMRKMPSSCSRPSRCAAVLLSPSFMKTAKP